MLHGHGDDMYNCPQAVKSNFSSNIFGATDLSGLREHLTARMDRLSSYPEPEPLTLEAKWASAHGLHPGEVCVTNGATEAIYLIAQATDVQRICRRLPDTRTHSQGDLYRRGY